MNHLHANHSHAKSSSPCIGQCCLDDQELCVGCFRRLPEILSWTDMTNEQRQQVLVNCQQRKIENNI